MTTIDREGRSVILRGAEATDATPSELRYTMRSFAFPTGSIEEITFVKGSAARHLLGPETELFVLRGTVALEGPDGSVALAAGDAYNRPRGVLRPTSADEAVVIAWTVGSAVPNSQPMLFPMTKTHPEPVANWVEDGKEVYARGEDQLRGRTPTAGASRWISRRYQFDGNSIRWADFRKGGVTVWATPQTDNLIYIAKGAFRRVEGPEVEIVRAGDVVREEAGLRGRWEVIEEAAFLSSTAPPRP
jgi:uncharacterized cupin superfamily protein